MLGLFVADSISNTVGLSCQVVHLALYLVSVIDPFVSQGLKPELGECDLGADVHSDEPLAGGDAYGGGDDLPINPSTTGPENGHDDLLDLSEEWLETVEDSDLQVVFAKLATKTHKAM